MSNLKITDLNATMAYVLGFQTKKELMNFIKNHNVNVNKPFDSLHIDILKIKNKLLQQKQQNQYNEILEMERLRKIKKSSDAIHLTVSYLIYSPLDEESDNIDKRKIITDKFGNKHYLKYSGSVNTTDNIVKKYIKKRVFFYDGKIFSELLSIVDANPCSDGYSAIIILDVKHATEDEIENAKNKNFKQEYKKSDLFNEDSERGYYHPLINYDINKDAKSFNELFKVPVTTDYCKDNYRSNSCFLNILVDTYYESFKNCKNYKFNATYEDFAELLDIDLKNDNIGISINKSLIFFKKFKLKLFVIGIYGIIEVYKPDVANGKISPDCLYLLATNNHVYKLDDKLKKSFSQTLWDRNKQLDYELEQVKIANLRNEYNIRNTSCETNVVKFIKKLNDITEYVKTSIDSDSKFLKFVFEGDLKDILFEMTCHEPSYYPSLYIENGKILQLGFKIGSLYGSIQRCDIKKPDDNDVILQNPEVYKSYHDADDELYKHLFTTDHMSFYNPQNINIEKLYPIRPMCGNFSNDDVCNIKYNGIDSRKAYTSDFMDIEYYPVYNYFDVWQMYDNHKIEDYNQYIVRCNDKKKYTEVLFPYTISRVTGYLLNRITDVEYSIISFKRPSKLVHSNSKHLIEKLYNTQISSNPFEDTRLKKFIFNSNSGLLEKNKNKKTFSKVFKNYDEAFYYQTIHGGIIMTLGEDSTVFQNEKRLFILVKKEEVELINGFNPIKEMIYSIRALKNYRTIQKLISNNIRVVGIKTDSILINIKDTNKAKLLFDFSDKFGCFKLETNKELPSILIERIKTKEYVFKNEIKVHKISNEFDKNEINKVITSHDLVILGKLPGVGKTTTAKNYDCKSKLFVSPYNKLCQQLKKSGFDAITLNMLLGFGCNDEQNSKMKEYNISSYDCIVFDEILLYTPKMLMKIDRFMKAHKAIRFLATGDCNQNAPIGIDQYENIKDKSAYLMNCLNIMFPNQIILEQSKRLKNEKDIIKMIKLKNDIFDESKDVMETLKEYNFKIISNKKHIVTKTNICFFNYKCNMTNMYVHDNLVKKPKVKCNINDIDYWKGLEIICKQYLKTSKFKLYVNYTYVIKSVNNDSVVIHEPVEDVTIRIDTNILQKHFRLAYANTNHSVQGLTIEDEYTIFDCDTAYVNRNWIWTALTRAEHLDKITIFESPVVELSQLDRSKRKQYIVNKISGYKAQDIKAGREILKDEYITADWFKEMFQKQFQECYRCKCQLEMNIHNGNVRSNITADRIDNSKCHTIDNCVLMCSACNNGKSNK